MASVIVLQTLHGLSDREAVEAVRFDLRWKAACEMAVDAAGFHPSTLTYWRRRLADSQRPQRIFEVVREVIIATGVLRGRHRRALDSTVLDDAVARQDTVTQLIAAVRRVGRDVPGAEALITSVCLFDYAQAGKPQIAWDDPAARDELVSVLVSDATNLLAGLDLSDPRGEGGGVSRNLGVGGRAGCRAGRGLRWHRRAVADCPEGRAGSDGLDGGSGVAACSQDAGTQAGRVQGASGGRARHRAGDRGGVDQGDRPRPLRVRDVRLAARQVPGMCWVDQHQLERATFQQVVERLPVITGSLHHHQGHSCLDEMSRSRKTSAVTDPNVVIVLA